MTTCFTSFIAPAPFFSAPCASARCTFGGISDVAAAAAATCPAPFKRRRRVHPPFTPEKLSVFIANRIAPPSPSDNQHPVKISPPPRIRVPHLRAQLYH